MNRADKDLAYMLQYEHVAWYEDREVRILDRRVYPREVSYVRCRHHSEVAQAIADMVTQSAGPYTAASMGMALAASEVANKRSSEQFAYLSNAAYTLSHARPTTVNRMTLITQGCLQVAQRALEEGLPVDSAIFQHTLESMNRRYQKIDQVAGHLVSTFPQNGTVMTQCFGETIVGMMLRESQRRGLNIKLFCPETRPFLQGARFTATVARDMGFDVTVITDNMPAMVMAEKGVDVFTSAADSICLDGHIVNKVGTLQIAIVAHHFGVPYYVTGIPDKELKQISQVTIEERNPMEVLSCHGIQHTTDGVKGYYPSFDITPPSLVSGVVTDKGIFEAMGLHKYYKEPADQYW